MARGSTAREQVVRSITRLLLDCPHATAEPRGGGTNLIRRNKDMRKQILRILNPSDDHEEEPEDRTASAQQRQKLQDEDTRLGGHIEKAASSGNISIATRGLQNTQKGDLSQAPVFQSVQGLHPTGPRPLIPVCDTPALQIDSETFSAVLDRVKRTCVGKSPGPSGWTYEMILAVATGSARGYDASLRFVNLILTGELPRECGLLGGNLIALLKDRHPGYTPENPAAARYRPIVSNEAWYCVATKCAMEAVGRELGQSLAPLQVGIGISGGVEAVAHSVKAALEADEENILVTLDMRNAFNEMHRDVILEAVKEYCPQLLPLVVWAYGDHRTLQAVGAGTEVSSQRGPLQGDPLSPLLFALGFHKVLKAMAAAAPESPPVAYLDDVTLVARGPAVRKILGSMLGDGPASASSAGLTAVPRKCGLYTPHARAQAECSKIARDFGIPQRPDGAVIVGVPVGTEAFIKATVMEKADGAIALVNKLMSLSSVSKQTKFQMLRQSLSAKLAHFPRALPWHLIEAAIGKLERAVVNAVAAIFSLPRIAGPTARADLPIELQQLILPFRHGGFGLRYTSAIEAEAAFFSGLGAAHRVMREAPPAFRVLEGRGAEQLQVRWQALRADCPAIRERLEREKTDSLATTDTLANLSFVQNIAARAVADAAGATPLHVEPRKDCRGNTIRGQPRLEEQRHMARLRSAAGAGASGFLTALPTSRRTTMGNITFTSAGRHRLGLSAYPGVDVPLCKCKGDNAGKPDHPVICKDHAKCITLRHDKVYDNLRDVLAKAGISTTDEPPFQEMQNALGEGEEGLHRADILAILPGGRSVMIDVTIVHPLGSKRVSSAWHTFGAAAKWAEKRKWEKWQGFVDKPQYEFVPFAVETYGRLGPQASAFLKEIGEIAASSGRVSKSRFMMNAYRSLSCALQTWNSSLYAKSQVVAARAKGRHFIAGYDEPVEG